MTNIHSFGQIYPTQNFKGKQHIFLDNHWRILNESGEFTKMEDSVITVKYKSSTNTSKISSIENANSLSFLRKSKAGYIDYQVNMDSIFAIVNSLNISNDVEFVKLNYYGKLLTNPCTPNDSFYTNNSMIYLDVIKAPEMWALMYCTENPVNDCHPIVAVIDNGIDITHPDLGMGNDLYENIYKNTLEGDWTDPIDPTSGDNIDNDNNGFVDDYKGLDFTSNIGPLYFADNDVKFETLGIPTNIVLQHGTKVAGIIAAKTNNGIGIAGIAGGWTNKAGAQIMAINVDKSPGYIAESVVDNAIDYARENGAKIINMSIGLGETIIQDVEHALELAHKDGIILVAASGNNEGGFNWAMKYPATSKYCISVGATSIYDTWLGYSCYLNGTLDLVAPHANVSTYDPQTYIYPTPDGTSYSAPLVSGTAANMLCMNPCLTTEWTRDILRNTADKVTALYNPPGIYPEGYNDKFGYGRLNAYEAVKTAKKVYSSTLDLYIKDCDYDMGLTGADYACTNSTDASPDIWIRMQPDGFQTDEHEVPEYPLASQVYVYVRVRNKSCVASNGTEQLKVYFSKAATWTSWPTNWDGSMPTLGGPLGASFPITLPILQPGEVKIIEIPWTLPQILTDYHNPPFCILARLENVAGDPIVGGVSSVELNNNVSIRNTMLLSHGSQIIGNTLGNGHFFPLGGYIDVVNPNDDPAVFDFHFTTPTLNNGNIITDVAEIAVIFDDSSWYAFQSATQFEQDGIEITQENEIKITKNNSIIKGVTLPAHSRYTMFVGVKFLVDSFSTNRKYNYLVSQSYADSSTYLGGENITIQQNTRIPFNADAGADRSVFIGDTVGLMASEVNETVLYEWYQGSVLKHTGRFYNPTIDSTQVYTLKVTSTNDGSIDYDDVKINIKSGKITALYPNPCTNSITVDYNTLHVNTASLLLIHPYYLTMGTFPLNVNNSYTTIDMSTYPIGTYSILLLCDNNIQDIKSLL